MLGFALASLLAAGGLVSAHGPGHDHVRERAERRQFLDIHTNSLGHCLNKHGTEGLYQRAAQRRELRARSLVAPSSLHAPKGNLLVLSIAEGKIKGTVEG